MRNFSFYEGYKGGVYSFCRSTSAYIYNNYLINENCSWLSTSVVTSPLINQSVQTEVKLCLLHRCWLLLLISFVTGQILLFLLSILQAFLAVLFVITKYYNNGQN